MALGILETTVNHTPFSFNIEIKIFTKHLIAYQQRIELADSK
jgi:hypothetical protein